MRQNLKVGQKVARVRVEGLDGRPVNPNARVDILPLAVIGNIYTIREILDFDFLEAEPDALRVFQAIRLVEMKRITQSLSNPNDTIDDVPYAAQLFRPLVEDKAEGKQTTSIDLFKSIAAGTTVVPMREDENA